jgi:hypothetical protein
MWFDYDTPKKEVALVKLVINHVSNSGQWWNMLKSFFSIITSRAQSGEQPSRHKINNTL